MVQKSKIREEDHSQFRLWEGLLNCNIFTSWRLKRLLRRQRDVSWKLSIIRRMNTLSSLKF